MHPLIRACIACSACKQYIITHSSIHTSHYRLMSAPAGGGRAAWLDAPVTRIRVRARACACERAEGSREGWGNRVHARMNARTRARTHTHTHARARTHTRTSNIALGQQARSVALAAARLARHKRQGGAVRHRARTPSGVLGMRGACRARGQRHRRAYLAASRWHRPSKRRGPVIFRRPRAHSSPLLSGHRSLELGKSRTGGRAA